MGLRIKVERGGGLWRQEWEFVYFEDRHALVLDRYRSQERPSKRAGFSTIAGGYYDRLNARGSTIEEAGVIVPADVAEEAAGKFVEGLRVAKWSESAGSQTGEA